MGRRREPSAHFSPRPPPPAPGPGFACSHETAASVVGRPAVASSQPPRPCSLATPSRDAASGVLQAIGPGVSLIAAPAPLPRREAALPQQPPVVLEQLARPRPRPPSNYAPPFGPHDGQSATIGAPGARRHWPVAGPPAGAPAGAHRTAPQICLCGLALSAAAPCCLGGQTMQLTEPVRELVALMARPVLRLSTRRNYLKCAPPPSAPCRLRPPAA